MAESDIWKKEENLENAKELVDEFEERVEAEIRRVERVNQKWRVKTNLRAEKFRRSKLLRRYIAKILYG